MRRRKPWRPIRCTCCYRRATQRPRTRRRRSVPLARPVDDAHIRNQVAYRAAPNVCLKFAGRLCRKCHRDRHALFSSSSAIFCRVVFPSAAVDGIVSTGDGHKIALFFSGRQHAGENLKDVLVRRAQDLPPPIQMCDALSRNLPAELKTIVGNCLVHGRRRFADVFDDFPEECGHVLDRLGAVYHNDALAREQKMSPQQRLDFHQRESGPVMEELHVWLVRQLDDRLVEPNSALGVAISYLLKHWEKLTLFLPSGGRAAG